MASEKQKHEECKHLKKKKIYEKVQKLAEEESTQQNETKIKDLVASLISEFTGEHHDKVFVYFVKSNKTAFLLWILEDLKPELYTQSKNVSQIMDYTSVVPKITYNEVPLFFLVHIYGIHGL
ncbi:hypothetical protein K435DRAFT_800047 [Dendrothele bispora CBS 962.96]|uniref:Uncharacterized protein n=1 Tax=Dendrothele bispora (strain CBS 962.96) TaxID=1314807 RepID=A0A4S8LVD9_DENBC|nr:hypothetical protein K435DRAFT_800047 [Dendrothele bispora CBS 962.96]